MKSRPILSKTTTTTITTIDQDQNSGRKLCVKCVHRISDGLRHISPSQEELKKVEKEEEEEEEEGVKEEEEQTGGGPRPLSNK